MYAHQCVSECVYYLSRLGKFQLFHTKTHTCFFYMSRVSEAHFFYNNSAIFLYAPKSIKLSVCVCKLERERESQRENVSLPPSLSIIHSCLEMIFKNVSSHHDLKLKECCVLIGCLLLEFCPNRVTSLLLFAHNC